MSAAAAGATPGLPASFEIKSANLPLVALLLKSGNLDTLAADLAQQFGSSPDFFDHEPLVLDVSSLTDVEPPDFGALLKLLRRYRMAPVAVRGGSPGMLAAAWEAGLAAAPDAVERVSSRPDFLILAYPWLEATDLNAGGDSEYCRFARMARGEALDIREKLYIKAARVSVVVCGRMVSSLLISAMPSGSLTLITDLAK